MGAVPVAGAVVVVLGVVADGMVGIVGRLATSIVADAGVAT
jgi:hypothetical protein